MTHKQEPGQPATTSDKTNTATAPGKTEEHTAQNLKVASVPTLRRLPVYLELLKRWKRAEQENVSCTRIAEELNLQPIQVRKDIETTSIRGTPRIGYPVNQLIAAIEEFLGWNNTRNAFLVGAGNLGSAIMGYQGFREYGLEIVAAFDTNTSLIGTHIHGIRILPPAKLPGLVQRMKIRIGILTVPAEAAQPAADLMIDAGIQAIWNFAPTNLTVPQGVIVQNEHLAASLAVLSRQLTAGTEISDTHETEESK